MMIVKLIDGTTINISQKTANTLMKAMFENPATYQFIKPKDSEDLEFMVDATKILCIYQPQ